MVKRHKRASSIRTPFLLAMSFLILILSVPLLLAGSYLLKNIITQLGTEILSEKLTALIQPVDRRYETLKRIGLEDSQSHCEEIRKSALTAFADFQYKETGTVFVIGADKKIFLSKDFSSSTTPDFDNFFSHFSRKSPGKAAYTVKNKKKLALFHFYAPWQSYIGISITHAELFAAHDLFLKINLLVLTVALAIALVFMFGMQRLIITPIIRLAKFASRITEGDYQTPAKGNFILELGILKENVTIMVNTLRQKMQETSLQLKTIRERETERDKALSDLRDSEEQYREIYNASSDAIFIHDAATGKILQINQAMLHMYGFSQEEALQLTMSDVSAGHLPYTEKAAENRLHATVADGPQIFEWHAKKKNGECFWVEMAMKLAKFKEKKIIIAAVRDINARKLAEQALAAEKEHLAVTLRSIGDGVITTDIHGRIVLLNRVAENLTGWSQADAFGHQLSKVFQILNSKTGKSCENPASQVLSSGNIITLENNTVLISKDGTKRNISDSGAPILDQESRIIGVVLVFRDVEEKLHLEQEMLKVKKLESVGVLAGGIAHDFNNILAAILGNINLAKLMIDDKEELHTLLDEAEKASMRAKDLTQQLLTFSKGGAPIREISSIENIIRESSTFTLRGSNVKCVFDIPPNLWLVKIDQGQMSQVIQNLILNARQAMPEGGTITISCQNVLNSTNKREGRRKNFVKIIIKDTGVGIPENIIEKIFDPYFSSKDQGSGLGLSICHSIIRNHDGHIEVDSAAGHGTSFTILLPASEDSAVEMQSEEKRPQETRRAKILVMDDEKMVRDIVARMLQLKGHEVILAKHGEEAVMYYENAQQSGVPFDLSIMDLTIPGGMGGQEAVQKIQQLNEKAKVIVSSGYSNDPIMADYRQYGFCAAVVKPFQAKELLRMIDRALSL